MRKQTDFSSLEGFLSLIQHLGIAHGMVPPFGTQNPLSFELDVELRSFRGFLGDLCHETVKNREISLILISSQFNLF